MTERCLVVEQYTNLSLVTSTAATRCCAAGAFGLTTYGSGDAEGTLANTSKVTTTNEQP